MTPLIGIAVNLLPELAKRLALDSSKETRELIAGIVRQVLKTDDPEEARRRALDARASAELRLRLAEIEAKAEVRERQDELRRFEALVTDKQSARDSMVALEKQDSLLAWGPVLVSTIVVAGFFATLLYLITLIQAGLGTSANPSDQMILQIVNIAVGALTAGFATVVSFWLGSSDGSRRKDAAAVQTHSAVAQIQRDSAAASRDMVAEQSRQTSALIDRMARQGSAADAALAAPAGGRKDARQFMRCVDLVLLHEGGFADHPSDPGGATNMGITHKTLSAWRGRPVAASDVRSLTRDEAYEIYRANYWNALSCDSLPAGVDLVVFDFGVNAGVGRSAKLLQKLVHVEQDGQIGPITVGAVKAIDRTHIVNAFSDGRMDHYRSLSHWDTFKGGWTRRTAEIRAAALEML